MKITVLHGQSHKGSTYHMAQFFCRQLGGQVTEFFLPRDFGAFCVGCTRCFTQSEDLCPHAAALRPITQALDEADVIVLASPVYVYHATGPMKALLDHYGWRWMIHRPQESMFTKQAVCISTAAGGGMKSTNKDMADSLFFWGIPKIYRYGLAVYATSYSQIKDKIKRKIDLETTELADRIRKGHGHVSPGIKTRAWFFILHLAQRKGAVEADRIYWKEKGWTGRKRPWKTEHSSQGNEN